MNHTIPKELYGIIGHPLGHTMSPLLHNWGFTTMDVPGAYLAWPLAPERVEDFITSVRTLNIRGVSITIPHKESVIPLLDGVSDRARKIGAVNTLYWKDEKLWGENTDVDGFLAPIQDQKYASALVLGAGGACRAVLAGLQELGVRDIFLSNRTLEKAQSLGNEFNVRVVEWEKRFACQAQLVINGTPLGMKGKTEAMTPWPKECFQEGQTAYDLVYNPLETKFLKQAREQNCRPVDGLNMFINQAAAQFKLWTGLDLPLLPARELVEKTLLG